MALRTADEYLAGLDPAREVWYRGERVDDVADHHEIGVAARHSAIDFDLTHDPAAKDLAVAHDDEGQPFSAHWLLPRSTEDLLRRSHLIEHATAEGGTVVTLIKEIGSDALFALHRVLADQPEALARVAARLRAYRDGDLAVGVAQTDVKGDRGKAPSAQDDPDLNLRVVERRDDGIVVRGAKVHTSCAPYCDELVVLPSRTLRPGEEDWAVAFAIPVATPGLRLIASDFLDGVTGPMTAPVSHRHKMVESLTVFDDVFVPNERIFVDGDITAASAAALAFVEYHRFTAVSYKLPLVDAFVGLSATIVEANGTSRAGHVRDKLTWLVGYAETVRALTHAAAERARRHGELVVPDPMTTNLAKWTFAREYHRAVELVQDLSGGILVTAPSEADWSHPETGPLLRKYFAAAWPGEDRMRLLATVSDLTARPLGGWQAVLAVHAEGSIEAEKLALWRAYDAAPARALALRIAGVEGRT